MIEKMTYQEFTNNKKEWLNLVSVEEFEGTGPKISVCIPTFEQYGYGVKNLNHLLHSLQNQTADFEVIVSDNSINDDIKDLCAAAGRIAKLDIKYFHNKNIGISVNTNNAIKNATTDFIKIMYMDDVLIDKSALSEFSKALQHSHWATSYTRSIDENGVPFKNHVPRWRDDIIHRMGKNTMGMPSILAFRKNEFEFDPNLKTLLDCEFMWLMNKKYGPPKIIPKYLVGQRYWPNQTSHVQGNHRVTEADYLSKKHKLF